MNSDYVSLDIELSLKPSRPHSLPVSKWGSGLQPHQFCYLSATDLARCGSVNKQWQLTLSDAFSSIWREVFHRDFCLPLNDKKERNYQVLYKQKVCTHLNIKIHRSAKALITSSEYSSIILVNNLLVEAVFGNISLYRITPYQLEQIITSFPSSASPNILKRQNEETMGKSLLEHRLDSSLVLSRAGEDHFFSRSKAGSTVCLWEATTGKCLFSNDNISTDLRDDLQLVGDLVIYTTNRKQKKEDNRTIGEVQLWNYKNQQLIGEFNFDHCCHYYRHTLKNKILISENGHKIIGHNLETKKKNYEFVANVDMQIETTDRYLLIYRRSAKKIEIYEINNGSLIHQLPCAPVAISSTNKRFLSYKNYCFILPSGDGQIQVWDLEKGELSTLTTIHANCAFIIHHDRLIAHYTYEAQGHLQVWNLKDFSVLISTECKVGFLNFMDDNLLALDVSDPQDGFVQILFWDILAGKFLGYWNEIDTFFPIRPASPYQIDFLRGKMFIKNSWMRSKRYGDGTTEVTWGGTILDFSVNFKPKSKPKTVGQKTLSAVKSIFCCLK